MDGKTLVGAVDLARLQRLRKLRLRVSAALFLLASLLVCSISAPRAAFHENVEGVGAVLIALAILGRTWCTLYIGGRKRQEIVDVGPYSLSRNPLYVFTLIGATGVGLCTGMISMGVLAFAAAFWVFSSVIAAEEVFLADRFGSGYADYRARVPRWLPIGPWRGVEEVAIRPALVVTTFLEACLMLLAFPVLEWIDLLHAKGVIPLLVLLP